MKQTSLKSWITKAAGDCTRARKRCVTCANTQLAALLLEFAELRAKGSTVSWSYFHRHYVVGELKLQVPYLTMMNHVRNCAGVRSG